MYLPLSICATKAHAYEMNWLWSSLGNHYSGNNNVIILTGGRNPRIYEMKGVLFKPLLQVFQKTVCSYLENDSRPMSLQLWSLFRQSPSHRRRTGIGYQLGIWPDAGSCWRMVPITTTNLPSFQWTSSFSSFLSDLCEETRIMWMFAFCMHIRTKIQTQTLQSHICKMTCFLLPQWH